MPIINILNVKEIKLHSRIILSKLIILVFILQFNKSNFFFNLKLKFTALRNKTLAKLEEIDNMFKFFEALLKLQKAKQLC